MSDSVRFDWQRTERTGIPEVVFALGKTVPQLAAIAASALEKGQRVLMTRVDANKADGLLEKLGTDITWDEPSRTVIVGAGQVTEQYSHAPEVAIVAAGTSDHALVAEIEQCLKFLGVKPSSYVDVGVAGLWRLTDLAEELDHFPLFIAVAGMEGALFSVLAGLVKGPVIAVPSPVGYGVSAGGHAALQSALSSCAPGIAVVNIDNGFGAAALAVKMLKMR